MSKRIIGFVLLVIVVSFAFTRALSLPDKAKKDELFRQVSIFADALAIIETDYVDDVKPKDMIYGALKGMLSSLDPHSQFLDPENYNELKVDTEGKFGGIGIEITVQDGLLTVVSPIEGTPAWRVGIKPQDRIVKIDDEVTKDMTIADAVKKLRGRPGSSVRLSVLRESQKRVIEYKVVRDVIRIKDIKEVRILEDGIGYIRLVEFRETTPRELDNALERLKKDKMTGLIIDLRNDPGGLLEIAVKVTEKFIPADKLIVSTKGRKKDQNVDFFSHADKPLLDLPLLILINEGSASGSEIVAACLQDYKRAIILGTKSFGKGSVQTVIPLSDGSALRLTTARYFSPLGKEIHGKGVTPDIEVAETINQLPEVTDSWKEKGNDSQLIRAIEALKAFRIYKGLKLDESKK